MAYALNEKEREDEELAQEGQGQQLGAESAIVQDSPEPTEQTDKGSGQYVNLQSYLEANKPQQFGQQVAGKLGEAVVGAEGAQKEAESKFKGLSDQGSIKEDPNLIQEAVARPEDVLKDQQKRESFTKMRDARYQGPNQLAETEFYDPTQRATREASEQAEASKDESGRRSLLDQYYGAGAGKYDYTRGQKKLDELLISGDQGAKTAFEQQQAKAGMLNPAFQNLQQSLGDYANQRKLETEKTAQNVKSKVGGAQSETQAQIEKRLADAVAARNARIEQERQRNAQGQATAAEIGRTGEMRTFGVDPSKYLRIGSDPTRHNVVDPSQRGRYEALAELMGQGQGWLPDAAQAGTYNPENDISYDPSMFGEISAREARYNDIFNAPIFQYGTPVNSGEVSFGPGLGNYAPSGEDFSWAQGLEGLTSGSLQDQLNEWNRLVQVAGDPNSPWIAGYQRARYADIQNALNKLQEQRQYNKKVQFV